MRQQEKEGDSGAITGVLLGLREFAGKRLMRYSKSTDRDTRERGGGVDMTKFVNKIHNIELPPKQLRELGLDKNWSRQVPKDYIEKVVKTAERFKHDLKELAKR
jgi:hypothetical protein